MTFKMRSCILPLILIPVLLEAMPAFALPNGWPVPYGSITSGIGWRLDPFGSGRIKWHNGIDIAVPINTPVTPTAPGLVRYAGWHRDYGWLVVVDHHDGWFTMYGHNSALAIKVGQEVTPETVIAYAGSTGRSTGVHLHYERRWFPAGTMTEHGEAIVNDLREYSDSEIREPQLSSGQRGAGGGQPGLNGNDPGFSEALGGE